MKDDKEAINAKLRPYLMDKELKEFWENREHPENECVIHDIQKGNAALSLALAFIWEKSAEGCNYWYEIYSRTFKAIEEQNKGMSEIQQIAGHLRQQIKSPMTLEQIIEEYKQDDYSAEMLLQHLLLWVANNKNNQ